MIKTHLQDLPHGITLSCRTAGEKGRPVLMFLHGFPEAAFVWDELLTYFAHPDNGGYRCIAPNLRGFERSSAPTDVSAYRAKFLVQDIAALIALEGGHLACLVAHDWGGAVAWNLAASQSALMDRLVIINSPHPSTFLRELQHSPAQQAASAYMNFLCRPDADQLLAEDDFRRLWEFFANMGAITGPHAWLTESVRQQYRDVWSRGLQGGCNYYRASPLRPATPQDPAASAISFPKEMFTVKLPTLVIWGMGDIALPPALIDGLGEFVPQMQLEKVEGATHWIVHEQPTLVIEHIRKFLR
ncbi:MAG: alpha/beta hydrolase [Polaromonas sp. 24-62-144]|jgi:pimeloyl-ACP methyl ester carboxylesterase|uniref:alpha/beta fold hydrolase n=1 Tax=Polaromonas sp. TaxID=1869339 RepID=UPI000BD78ED6|nr:alpha/beta hydrolase [Polaromonas sp.]OYY52036.1 MAG: alpha/beta hydrolase [Polaromonas sp. 35-63-240]OYZ84658.1 MAG: alpha/beta hydrolase [Polaromonas sp. 24-62-144]HQS32471.1 alpha/beta hydrolase [Polaromonas sp.]HQS91670.1 alpha/beta hydrolase [Polaromonas sp.]